MSTEQLCSATGLRQFKAVHSSAVVAHEPVLIEGIVAIPLDSADADVEMAYNHEVEGLAVDKAAGQVWSGAQKVYWNNTAKNFTTTEGSNTLCGFVISPAASDADRGQIHLTPNA